VAKTLPTHVFNRSMRVTTFQSESFVQSKSKNVRNENIWKKYLSIMQLMTIINSFRQAKSDADQSRAHKIRTRKKLRLEHKRFFKTPSHRMSEMIFSRYGKIFKNIFSRGCFFQKNSQKDILDVQRAC
jgi:hypothetical protein